MRVDMPHKVADEKRGKDEPFEFRLQRYYTAIDVNGLLMPLYIALSENDKKQAVLEVRDNGIGISAEDMEFVFNRLYRGKNAMSLEPDQSGVGLYTAKHIIELHGGTIDLQSAMGLGTTVTIALPKRS